MKKQGREFLMSLSQCLLLIKMSRRMSLDITGGYSHQALTFCHLEKMGRLIQKKGCEH